MRECNNITLLAGPVVIYIVLPSPGIMHACVHSCTSTTVVFLHHHALLLQWRQCWPLFCSKRYAVDYKGVSVCFLISYSKPQGTEARRVERAEAEEEEEQGDN